MAEAPGTHDPTFLPPDIPVAAGRGAARHLTGRKRPDLALPATRGGAVSWRSSTAAPCFTSIRVPACRASICRRDGTTSPARAAVRRNRAVFAIILPNSRRWQRRTCSACRPRTPIISARPPSGCTCRSRSCPMPSWHLPGALGLPTFSVAGMTLLKRMALVIDDGIIDKVFYPVFPPDKNAAEVIAWLLGD